MMRRIKKWLSEHTKRKETNDLQFEVKELTRAVNSHKAKIVELCSENEGLQKRIRLLEIDKEVLERERDLMALVIERDRERLISEASIKEVE